MTEPIETFNTVIKRWSTLRDAGPLHEYLGMSREELEAWAVTKRNLLNRPYLYAFEKADDIATLNLIADAYPE